MEWNGRLRAVDKLIGEAARRREAFEDLSGEVVRLQAEMFASVTGTPGQVEALDALDDSYGIREALDASPDPVIAAWRNNKR